MADGHQSGKGKWAVRLFKPPPTAQFAARFSNDWPAKAPDIAIAAYRCLRIIFFHFIATLSYNVKQ